MKKVYETPELEIELFTDSSYIYTDGEVNPSGGGLGWEEEDTELFNLRRTEGEIW